MVIISVQRFFHVQHSRCLVSSNRQRRCLFKPTTPSTTDNWQTNLSTQLLCKLSRCRLFCWCYLRELVMLTLSGVAEPESESVVVRAWKWVTCDSDGTCSGLTSCWPRVVLWLFSHSSWNTEHGLFQVPFAALAFFSCAATVCCHFGAVVELESSGQVSEQLLIVATHRKRVIVVVCWCCRRWYVCLCADRTVTTCMCSDSLVDVNWTS